MFEKITEDIKKAMLAKDKDRLNALRFYKSMLIENKTSKTPIDEMDVLIKHVKKLKDSLINFPAGSDLYLGTEREIAVLSDYMPAELSTEEVVREIKAILTAHPGLNVGLVMKELSPKIKGKFDSKKAMDLVKENITSFAN